MLFVSNEFLFLFLPASLIGYQLLSRFGRNAMLSWLTLTSLFFYGYWNPAYLVLLCGSILMNFLFSQRLGEGRSDEAQGRWLTIAIVANLALLMYFKYLFPVLNFLHIHGVLNHGFVDVILPLGISFFTFTQIAYLIDLRQGIAQRQGILPYSVFVTLFPHLIAGPIIHPRELMPQLEEGRIRGIHSDDFSVGLTWFVLGFAKKVMIADRLGPMTDILYAHPHSAGFATAWIGAICYNFQLYFDFSGYSDMALGLARMFGITFPLNFDSPYKAQGFIEFWQRWHMTLSRYITEYLFTPILRMVNSHRIDAGKKVSRKAMGTPEGFAQMVAFPVLLSMLIAGIWHGAGLQFIVFGLLHGLYITINHAWRFLTPQGHPLHRKVPPAFMVALTFLGFILSQVFFRAANVHDATYVLGTMIGLHHGPAFHAFPYLAELPSTSAFLGSATKALVAISVCFFIVWGTPNTQEILGQLPHGQLRMPSLFPALKWRVTMLWSFAVAAIFCISVLLLDGQTRFLYFQF